MQDFRNVEGWGKAHALVLRTYRETVGMPKDEIFGMTMLLRRTAIAVATRIAEGSGRNQNLEFAVDLRKAAASCNEMEYLIVLARDLTFWKPELAASLIEDTVEVRKMIFGLLRTM
jgi:four helix bundle protein